MAPAHTSNLDYTNRPMCWVWQYLIGRKEWFGGKRGYADMRVRGYAGMRICGYAGMRICGYADMRVCGYAGMRICGYAGMRICGYADMRVRRTGLTNRFQKLINNSKKNHSCEGVFICGKTHVDFHKTLTSIFSTYTTSIYWKFFHKQCDKMGKTYFIIIKHSWLCFK